MSSEGQFLIYHSLTCDEATVTRTTVPRVPVISTNGLTSTSSHQRYAEAFICSGKWMIDCARFDRTIFALIRGHFEQINKLHAPSTKWPNDHASTRLYFLHVFPIYGHSPCVCACGCVGVHEGGQAPNATDVLMERNHTRLPFPIISSLYTVSILGAVHIEPRMWKSY